MTYRTKAGSLIFVYLESQKIRENEAEKLFEEIITQISLSMVNTSIYKFNMFSTSKQEKYKENHT